MFQRGRGREEESLGGRVMPLKGGGLTTAVGGFGSGGGPQAKEWGSLAAAKCQDPGVPRESPEGARSLDTWIRAQ